MIKTHRESAVSEVISVVLVVALTVILAAIVAAYMFGMIPSLPTSHTVAVTASQVDNNNIVVVYHGGPDQASLSALNVSWPSGKLQNISSPKIGDVYQGINVGANPGPGINVTGGKDRIIVVGVFSNNVKQVVLDTYV